MAERRMYTKKITDSDSFITLSSSAQALYFHLCQAADDDGFNNQIAMAMYKAHASDDDFDALLGKHFILKFESGVIVIKHWRLHNSLRKDRYTETSYTDEKALLGIKPDGTYTLGCQTVANWLPDGCQTVAAGKVSIGKVSKGKDSVVEANAVATTTYSLFENIKGQPLTAYECEKLKKMVEEYGAEWTDDALKEMADYGKLKLGYAESILRRWKTDGKGTKKFAKADDGIITNNTNYSEVYR